MICRNQELHLIIEVQQSPAIPIEEAVLSLHQHQNLQTLKNINTEALIEVSEAYNEENIISEEHKQQNLTKLRSLLKDLLSKIDELADTMDKYYFKHKDKRIKAIDLEIKACKQVITSLEEKCKNDKRKLSKNFNEETAACTDEVFDEKQGELTAALIDLESTLRKERRKVNNLITHHENNKKKFLEDYDKLTEETKKAKKIIEYNTEVASKKKENKSSKVASKTSKPSSSTKASS